MARRRIPGWGLWAATGLLLLAAAPSLAGDPGFVVIVHPDVPADRLSMDELARLFQRRTTRWPDGTEVVPVETAGPARARFYEATMHMSVGEVGHFWVRQAMTAGVRPPRLLTAADLVVAYVGATPGAVAFVDASAPLGSRVRRVPVE